MTGNTLGYQAAEQAAYASLTGAAAVMAMYDGFEDRSDPTELLGSVEVGSPMESPLFFAAQSVEYGY